MQHSQNDFIIPALLVIDSHENGCGSITIKGEIHKYIELSPEDLEPYGSRRKSEPRYRQTVGNLISHHPYAMFKYLKEIDVRRDSSGRAIEYIWQLNDLGKTYIEQVKRVAKAGELLYEYSSKRGESEKKLAESISSIGESTELISILDQKKINSAGEKGRKTDNALKDAILTLSEYRCFYGRCVNENHDSFITPEGRPYMVVHHLIPMKASPDFFPRNLDRPSNMVCLCPTCHDKLHHGSEQEKGIILRVLYREMIEGLNDEEIYISYKNLMKYY